jgi:hypothetical protein
VKRNALRKQKKDAKANLEAAIKAKTEGAEEFKRLDNRLKDLEKNRFGLV